MSIDALGKRRTRKLRLSDGTEIEVKSLRVRDLFTISRALAKIFAAGNPEEAINVMQSLPLIEDEVYELVRSITGIEKPDELPAVDLAIIVRDVLENEDLSDFFELMERQVEKSKS